jgi:hypothetical protein
VRIVHQIATANTELINALDKLSVRFESYLGTDVPYCNVTEDDDSWKSVARLLEEHTGTFVDSVRTEYTQDELDDTDVLIMRPSWHHGYPQPTELDNEAHVFGFQRATYDLSAYCPCGIGAKQIAPFRMKKQPVWGRRSIMQLNWVFDEYFVRPEIWEALFRPFGIEKRPVLVHSTGAVMDNVVQLVISQETEANTDGLDYKTCPYHRCQSRKYMPSGEGHFPGPREMVMPICRSRQYFCDAAFNLIYVSHVLYTKIRQAELLGVGFHPCAPKSPA